MQLVLCAGNRLIKGWTHHDVKPLDGIEIVCELHDIGTYVTPKSCTHIQFTHALEHFPTKEIPDILALVKSLMAEGGELWLEVPNFAWHAQLVSEGRDADAVYYAFGGQEDEWDFHKTGFTPKLLQEALEGAGFNRIEVFNGSSLSAKCYA